MAHALPRQRREHESSPSSLVIHNVVVGAHRTSVRLEPVMWEALRDIARRRRVTMHDLVTDIDRKRTASSLTAAIRVASAGVTGGEGRCNQKRRGVSGSLRETTAIPRPVRRA